MKIVLARDFASVHDEVPSPDSSFGAAGTDNQTYLHAKHLVELGHEVYVVGNSKKDLEMQGIKYVGLAGMSQARIFALDIIPDLIIAEGGKFFSKVFGMSLDPDAKNKLINTYFLQVMHNVPQWDFHVRPDYIDYWCYVCKSQKFFHLLFPSFDLFNATLFESVHSKTTDYERKMQIVTMGAPTKPGIIDAINTIMKLQGYYDFKAVFLMPKWSLDSEKFIRLQKKYLNVRFDNLNLRNLSKLLKGSLTVISSFNPSEQCPLTILDAYATGTLCITGKKGSLRYLNPAGIRCNTEDLYDVIKWVLQNPAKCTKLGQKGLAYLKQSGHIESAQKAQLRHITEHLQEHKKQGYFHRQCGRVLFKIDRTSRISRARRILSDLQYAIKHNGWRSDVY